MPNLRVAVSGLLLFTGMIWKVSRIEIIVRRYVPDLWHLGGVEAPWMWFKFVAAVAASLNKEIYDIT